MLFFIRSFHSNLCKNYRKNIHWNSYDYKKFNLNNEYSNFIVSATNCLLVISLIWGVEQHNLKTKIIMDHHQKINELLLNCIEKDNKNIKNKLEFDLNDFSDNSREK